VAKTLQKVAKMGKSGKTATKTWQIIALESVFFGYTNVFFQCH
jgi:hypothetical protein